tara:strand:- start:464 stop:1423 length:960 start_codon:yes stop_codon:yes gene_type:complete
MDPKTKKKIIIGLSLTTILGVGGYFAYQWWKNNRPADENEDENENDTNVVTTQTPVISPPQSPNTGGGNRPGDVLAFQKWANANGYTPKLVEDGLWGPKSSAAWNAKKTAYTASVDTKANVSQLSGQLKDIYEKFMAASSLKGNTKAYLNTSTGVMNVSTVGNISGKKYIYVAGGSMYIYNKDGVQLAAANYSNNGLKLVVTLGIAKGKTFTGTSILKVANKASTNPQLEVTLTNSALADIVAKMYYAMKGGGTYVGTFMTAWKRMNTIADYNAVKSTFGKKDGYTLVQWMRGENDLMIPSKKNYFNAWFSNRGSNYKF